jgi:hypothetical protein
MCLPCAKGHFDTWLTHGRDQDETRISMTSRTDYGS